MGGPGGLPSIKACFFLAALRAWPPAAPRAPLSAPPARPGHTRAFCRPPLLRAAHNAALFSPPPGRQLRGRSPCQPRGHGQAALAGFQEAGALCVAGTGTPALAALSDWGVIC